MDNESPEVRYRQRPPNNYDNGDHPQAHEQPRRESHVGFYPKPTPEGVNPSYLATNTSDSGDNFESASQPKSGAPLHQHRPKKSCCASVFLGIFATRQLAGKGDRELYITYLIRELVIYLIYLVVLCLLTFGMTNATTYYFTRVIHDLFINHPFPSGNTFHSSTDVIDFWDFQDHVLKNLYYYEWGGVRRAVLEANNSKGLFYENQLIGVPRFRQLRVNWEVCPANREDYKFVARECYPSYSKNAEDTGKVKTHSWEATTRLAESVRKAWNYKTEKQLNGSSHWGRLATYSGAGAIQNLDKSNAATSQIITPLKQNLWITSGTRAVFLDFTMYNSNINLFCIARLLWEFSPTGAMTTSWSLRTVKLIRYVTDFDNYVVFPCEILFCIFTCYYLIQEIVEMVFLGCKEYFSDIWSWLDMGILIISGICIGFSIHRYNLVEEKLATIQLDEDAFIDFEYLGFWQTQFNHVVSIAVFFAWIKIFKYISFNKTMTQLSSTLSRCAKDIGGFAIMFFIVFFSFSQLGYLIFGSQVEDFSTFEDSIFTLLRLILGDFDYDQLEDANRILGPIFFVVYVFFVFFVLLNMFLAIINDTYGEVKAEIQAQRNEFEIADYFKRGFNKFAGLFGKSRAKLEAEALVKISDGSEEQITYDELRKNLLNAHFSEVEVEMFLARYELDQDRALDEEETQQVLADLEGKKIVLDKFDDKGNEATEIQDEDAIAEQERLYAEEFSDLQDRVALMETCIIGLQKKLEELMTRL